MPNDASPSFVYHVLSKGWVLVEKRLGIAVIARIHVLEEVRKLRHVENYSKMLEATIINPINFAPTKTSIDTQRSR